MAPIEDNNDPYKELTDREREMLKLIVEGYKTRQIAEMLAITPKTVEAHKTSLMKKLDIHSSLELVKFALRRGIISL
jgi:two-component system response regulator NreC